MIIDCVSDCHGFYPELEGGDLLIVAGDLTARDIHSEYLKFFKWLHNQKYRHYIFIGGNHDNLLQNGEVVTSGLYNTTYLCDSGIEFEGLRIWGSPWTKTFPGMNPKCMAFTEPYGCDEEYWLGDHWDLIPEDTDILITHSPPYGILDQNIYLENCGSASLAERLINLPNIQLHCFGHIHESYNQGLFMTIKPNDWNECKIVNASHVNEKYEPVNKPIRVIL